MLDKNKIILEYLKDKLSEVKTTIEQTKKEYPCDSNDSFCHECGYHTHDASYHDEVEELFLLKEIENIKKESEEING